MFTEFAGRTVTVARRTGMAQRLLHDLALSRPPVAATPQVMAFPCPAPNPRLAWMPLLPLRSRVASGRCASTGKLGGRRKDGGGGGGGGGGGSKGRSPSYLTAREFESDAWIIEGLPREGEEPATMDDDAKLSTLLMELYHAEGRPQVLELVDELKDAGALAKPTVVTSMLNDLVRRQMTSEAIELRDQLSAPNVYHYNVMINMHARVNDIAAALGIFAEMDAAGVEPIGASFGNVIKQCKKFDHHKMLVVLVERMLAAGIKPAPFAFNSFVRACAMLGEFDRAIVLFDELKAAGSSRAPTRNMWMAMVKGYGSVGDVSSADRTFQDMKAAGITPDANSFHVAITACAQNHDLHRGVAFYQEMHASQLAANVITYTQLINLCSACGHAAGVEETFSTALSRGHFMAAVTSTRHPYAESTQNAIYLMRLSKRVAVEAVQYKLGRLTEQDLGLGLGIITGTGKHLPGAVAALLATDAYASLAAVVDPQNAGVILIDPARLAAWHNARGQPLWRAAKGKGGHRAGHRTDV